MCFGIAVAQIYFILVLSNIVRLIQPVVENLHERLFFSHSAYHSESKVAELSAHAGLVSSIVVDNASRVTLDLCMESVLSLEAAHFDRSEIKFGVEKLVLDAKRKVRAPTYINLSLHTVWYGNITFS